MTGSEICLGDKVRQSIAGAKLEVQKESGSTVDELVVGVILKV